MNTDSGFGCLLRSISRSQAILERATVYRARCGRRRTYLCERSALAYEDAFANWPHQPQGPKGTPAWDAYFDREQQEQDAREYEAARAEERASL